MTDDPDAKLAAYCRQLAARLRHDAAIGRREAEMYSSPSIKRQCLAAAEDRERSAQRLEAEAKDYAAAARASG